MLYWKSTFPTEATTARIQSPTSPQEASQNQTALMISTTCCRLPPSIRLSPQLLHLDLRQDPNQLKLQRQLALLVWLPNPVLVVRGDGNRT